MNAGTLAIAVSLLVFLNGYAIRTNAQVTISGPASVCAGVGVNAYSAVGGSFPYTWTVSSTGAAPIVVSGNTPVITVDWGSLPGTGTVNVVTGSGSASLTVLIGVATPAISGVFSVCTSSVYPYSVAYPVIGEDYDWVVTGGSPPVWSGTSGIITWPGTPGTYTISLQASRPGEGSSVCYSDPFVQNVSVLAPPASGSAITGGLNEICIGASTTVNAPAPPPGTSYYNYVWTVTGSAPNVISFTGQGTSSITLTGGSVAGTASISVSYSNVLNGGCTATSATRNLTVVAAPVPTIAGSLLVCPGTTVPYTAAGSPGSSFTWSVSPVSGSWFGTISGTSSGPSVNVVWTNNSSVAQIGTVNVTEQNSTGCPGSGSLSVTIKPTPTVTPISDQVYCNGVIAPATPLTSSVAGTTFTWTNSNTAIGLGASGSGTSVPSFAATNGTASPISAVITVIPAAGGCTGPSYTYNITVYPAFVPGAAFSNQSVCAQTIPAMLTATIPSGGSAPYTYQWEQSTDNLTYIPIAGATNMNYQPPVLPVSTWYRQAQTSSGSCGTVYTNAIKITVNALPVPTISGASNACVNTSGNVYTTEAGMSAYAWTVTGGTIDGPVNTSSISVTWNSAGNQQITVNYNNASGCSAQSPASKIVTVQSTVIPSITGPDPSCTGFTVTYSTEPGMSAYVWTVSSGGSIVGASNTNSISVKWNAAGAQFVTVKYNDPNGCSTSSPTVKPVQVNASPAPTIIGTTSICPASSGIIYFTEQGMTDYTWTITPGGVITAGQGTYFISVDWIASGTQTITVNYKNASGCNAPAPAAKVITVLPTPQPVISGPVTACTGTTVYYNTEPGMTNYQWSLSAGGTIVSGSGSNSISVIWSVAGPHTVSVSYLNASGCPTLVPTVKNVTVNTTPLATIIGGDSVCQDGSLVFSTDPGMALYQWTVGPGGLITSGQGTSSVVVKWTQAGSPTISISYMSTNVCPSFAEKEITVLAPPVPIITGPAYACAGGTGVDFSTEPGMTGYTWSVSSGGSISAGAGTNSITVDWTGTGLQYVRVSYTNQYGCSAATPSQYNLAVNERPANPVITGSVSACVSNVDYTYSTQTGMGLYEWTVSPGGTILTSPSIHESTVAVRWNATGAQYVGVNYTSVAGCQALVPAQLPVTVNSLPVPTLSGPAEVCQGSQGNVYTTESGKSNYTWTVSPGGTVTAGGTSVSNSVTVTWSGAGTGFVTVNYANAANCFAAAPAVQTVTVSATPVPSISGPVTACTGMSGQVYQTEPGMTGYTWSLSSGGTIDAGQGTASITVTWTSAGPQDVGVTYTDGHGCSPAAPVSLPVTVLPAPTPLITGPTPVCNGSVEIYQTEPGMNNYQWTVTSGGTLVSGAGTNAPTIAWTSPGLQQVTVSYTNTSGCVTLAPTAKSVTVQNNVVATINGPVQSCTGHTETYMTEAGMQSYAWTVSAGGTIVGPANTGTVTILWNTAGNRSVSVIYTDPIGCTQAAPTVLPVAINASPAPSITGTASICQNSAGVVYFTEQGMTGYQWTVTSGGVITAGQGTNAITVDWTGAGTQTVTVNYISANGCNAASAGVKTINVLPLPLPVITGPGIICNGNTVSYSTTPGMINYAWTLSGGGTIVSGGSTNTINVRWTTVGNYTISVTYLNGASGCPTLVPGTIPVTVYPTPEPTITGADTVCIGGTVVFSTETGNALYQWSVGPGGIITSGAGTSSISVKWTQAGNRTVSVNYTNTSNCSAIQPVSKNILVYPSPVPVISGPAQACAGGAGFDYYTEAGMTGYSWTVLTGGTIIAGAGTNSVTVAWSTAGVHTLSVGYTDLHGCPAAAPTQYDVSVSPRPVPTITGTSTACAGSVNSTYSTQPGMLSYRWTVSAGGIILTTPSDHSSTITVAWNTPGNQWVSVNYVNTAGCDALTPAVFNCVVNPLPAPTVSGPATVCHLSSGNVYRTEGGKTNYTWIVSPGGTITAGGTSASDSVKVTWTTTGVKTVQVNYTDANSCTAAQPATLTVTVHALPAPSITGSATGCPGTTGNPYATETGMTGYFWSVSPGGTITSGQGSAAVSIAWLTAGTQSVTVNYTDINGCAASAATLKTIVVNPLPVPVITGGSDGCAGFATSYTTDQGMSGYLWTVSGGGTIIAGTNSPTVTVQWNVTGLQTLSVIYTNANGCTALPSTKSVTVRDQVVPTISGPSQACTGVPVMYSSEPGMTGYAWNISTSGIIVAGAGTHSVTVIWYNAGNQTIGVNYINQYGCTAALPSVKNVTVSASPVPWIDGNITSCQGSAGVTYSTLSGMQNYTWTISAGGLITAGAGTATVTVAWTGSGSQWIAVNYTDPAGCSAVTATVKSVTVSPAPVPVINGPAQVCNGSTVVYFTEPGMTSYQWTVSPGGTISSGAGTSIITVDWISSGSQSVTVTYLSADGCPPVNPTQFAVVVNALPVPSINHDPVACLNGTTVFYTEPGMTMYQWTVSSGGAIIAGAGTRSIVVSWSSTGAKTITVNYLDPNGCYPQQLSSKSVTVAALPVPTITGPGQACLGSTTNVYSTEPGMTNYQWAVSAGGTITAGQGTQSVTVTWNALAGQIVSVNYTSPDGCNAALPTQYPVIVNPQPVPTIAGTSVACVGSITSNYITDPGMTNYQWNISAGGTILTPSPTTASAITVAWNVAGNQWVSVNYTNPSGCNAANPSTKTVTVLAAPNPTISGVSAVCEGATGIAYSTEPGGVNYVWTVTPGGVITAGAGTNIITVSWLTAGTQTVTVNYFNANGCSAAAPTPKSVTVHPLPVPTISGSSSSCLNASTTHSTEAGMTGYLWTVSAGGTIQSGSGSNSIQVLWTTAGPKTVSVNYTNANGCMAAIPSTKSVTVYSLPAPTITGSTSVCTGATNITYTTEQGMVNYQWSVSAGGVITSGINTYMITVTWNSPGVQGVTVNYTDAHGCTAPVPTSLPVTVNTIPVPTISGSTSPCVTSGNYTYTTEQGMQNYVWTVSAGGIIVGGQGTRNVQIYWTASGSQSVSVGYSTLQGCISQITTLPVNVNPLPGAPGPVTGDTLICKPELGVLYFVNPIPGAIGYDWAIPAGATIVSGSNTNIITVNYGTAAQSGNISVFGVNTCGNGPYSPVLHVSVHPYPETPHVTVIEPDTLESSAPDGNQWYRNNVAIPGATAQRYVAYLPGDYFVIANPFGCPSDPSNVVGIYPVGQPETDDLSMQIYPNPADNKVTIAFGIRLKEGTLTVRMADNMGRVKHLVKDMRVHGEAIQNIDLGDPPNGIYYLLIQYGDRHFLRKLLIVNEQ